MATGISDEKAAPAGKTIKAATALVVVLFGFFVVILGVSISRDWRGAQVQAEQRALSASLVVSTNVRWLTELSQQALQRIDEGLGSDLERNASITAQLVRDVVGDLPGNAKSYVVAADGRTLFSTDPQVKPIDIRDREYFAALAKGQPWYFSPLLVSRLDDAQIFVISKRLERKGAFAGAAIISFDVALFREIWESLSFDHTSTVGVFRKDGQLVARYPFAVGPLDLSRYALFTDYLKKSDIGNYRTLSPADGVDRFVGYRRVPGTDYIALASIDATLALKPFWRSTLTILFFVLPSAAMLAAAAFWILRLLRQEHAVRDQLIKALDHNRLLVQDTHHRVKNNLQAIMSMVRIHPLPATLKADLQSRIAAMSAVHEHLYRLDRFSEVNAEELIPAIVDPLLPSMTAHPPVTRYEIDELVLHHDCATSFALLINEVVTNAVKYGRPEHGVARLTVQFKAQTNGGCQLCIGDNGTGFDPAVASKGLGTRLIGAMVGQLGGTFRYEFKDGTIFIAEFDSRLIDTEAVSMRHRQNPDLETSGAAEVGDRRRQVSE